MVNLPPPPHTHTFHDKGTNTMRDGPRGNYTIWQTFPMKEYHMANLPRKKTHSRTSPEGNTTIWHDPPPLPPEEIPWQNLGGGGGGKKFHRWGTFTMWYFIRGKEIHGGGGGGERTYHVTTDSPYSGNMMYPPQQKKSIPYNYNQPYIYISRNMSTCVVTSRLAHNQRLQVSG